MENCFLSADILLPKKADMQRWSVIACDQFTSDLAYWKRVREFVGDEFSTLHMILPEAELSQIGEQAYADASAYMENSLHNELFSCYKDAFVYVERTQLDGSIRPGIVGRIDLTAYEFDPEKDAPICATEQTVLSRIPPRVALRKQASLEFPHAIMLCNDFECKLIESVTVMKDSLPKLYEFDLMEGGGHIAGWLVAGAAADSFREQLQVYIKCQNDTYGDQPHALFAVGDGNHSLVTAKCCYEESVKDGAPDTMENPARYALVELENIHTSALNFEPIHRVLTDVNVEKLLSDLKGICVADGCEITYITATEEGKLLLPVGKGQLAVTVLQEFLDKWLEENSGEIDYIHDEDSLTALAKVDNAVGLLLPAINKRGLFEYCSSGKVFPRKTFSMGHGREKRYYLEGRKIQ